MRDVQRLIRSLDERGEGVGDEAAEALFRLGSRVLPHLTSAVRSLGPSGRLGAIDVMRRLGDSSACPALVQLLNDEDETVREWAAAAVGELGCVEAGPELEALRAQQMEAGVPPDFTGPVAVRAALTRLGLRQRVVPVAVQSLAERFSEGPTCWSVSDLPGVIRTLAASDQVVLYIQVWRRGAGGELSWQEHEGAGWSFDAGRSWSDNVGLARDAALLEAACIQDVEGLVASVEWIDEADTRPR